MSEAAPFDLLARAKAGDGAARMELARAAARAGKRAEADFWISEAAAVGQRSALLQTAAWKLAGYRGTVDVAGGVALIRQTANDGEPASKALLATLHTTGTLGTKDWSTAKTLLVEAAQAHDPRALVQLALMLPHEKKWQTPRLSLLDRAAGKSYPAGLYFAGRTLLEDGSQDSQALARLTLAARANEPNALKLLRDRRTPVDRPDSPMFELTTVNWDKIAEAALWPHERLLPRPIIRHAAPRVATLNRLLSAEECEYIMSRGAPFLKQVAHATMPANGKRTNTMARFGLIESDPLIQSLDELITRALDQPDGVSEIFTLMHYAPGQTFSPAGEAPDVAKATTDIIANTHISKSAIVYLNEGYEGGESTFPRLGWRFKGRRGDALAWDIRTPEGKVDPRAVPEGKPPRSGDKFILSKWIRTVVHHAPTVVPQQAQA